MPSLKALFSNSATRRANVATAAALDRGLFRRFLHPPATTRLPPPPPLGLGSLMERRILLDGLAPSPLPRGVISVEEARKLVRLVEVVRLKAKLKEIPRSWITYEEFVGICGEDGDENYGVELAKRLDDSGAVIVLGNVVFLHPEQMAKAIGGLIPAPGLGTSSSEEWRMKELEEMEKEKAAIEEEARQGVRRELWWGMGFVVAQIAASVRLTFWDLTWDVMEPICYFVTSSYFVAGYAFFLATSREPSFQSLYRTRLLARQRRLIKLHHFDLPKYNRLRQHPN